MDPRREQTDEEMRVRVDGDVERMMENGVKINPRACSLKLAVPAAAERATYGSRRLRAGTRRPSGLHSRAQAARLPAALPWSLLPGAAKNCQFHRVWPPRLLRARYGKATG